MKNNYFLNGLLAVLISSFALHNLSHLRAVDSMFLTKPSLTHMPQVALTIYNQNFGVVRDQRKVTIQHNPETILFDNVAEKIEPTSVRFQSITDPHATLLQQYYAYDLVSTDILLQKYMHKLLDISLKDGSRYKGTLLHFDANQLTIFQEDAGLTMIPRERNIKEIHFNLLPQLFSSPSLIWNFATDMLGDQWIEASYHTTGLNWQADYNALLHDNDTKIDLQGLVTLTNESGATYPNAELKLIAGDVKKNTMHPMAMRVGNQFSKQHIPEAFQEQVLFTYHAYTLDHPVTVVNNQTKQIPLFQALDVPVKKLFVYEGAPHLYTQREPITDTHYGNEGGNKKVQVIVELINTSSNHMGMPLPAGTVRLYKNSGSEGAPEFIGEDTLNHTPRNATVRLVMGNAFDSIGERKRIDFQVDLSKHTMTETFEITLKNEGNTSIEVLVKEPLYRWNSWEITSSSISFEKQDASTIRFHVPVEENGQTNFTYTVRYTW